MEVISIRNANGVSILEFNPTQQMKLFAAVAFFDPEASGKDPETICRVAGIPYSAYKRFTTYEPHFSEWLESERARLGGKSKKAALEAVGMERSLAGEFNFWKAMAIKEGVIDPDRLDVGAALPSNLKSFEGMSNADIQSLYNSTMAALRSDDDAGEIQMVEGPQGWQRQGDSGGDPDVPEGSVALASELGADRECALSKLDDF